MNFLEAVDKERVQQRKRWGDAHDDLFFPPEWGNILLRYAGRVGEALERCDSADALEDTGESILLDLELAAIKVAAVCFAISEAVDRAILRQRGVEG